VYPLAQAAKPPPTKFADASGTLFDATIRYDASFYRNLDRVVQTEPWLQRDRAMIDALRTIGIEKGKPYAPSRATDQALDAAASAAHAWLAAQYDAGFPVMNPGIRWFPAARADVVHAVKDGYADANVYPVDARAHLHARLHRHQAHRHAQFYLMANKDADGNAFDGAATYRLTVPADAPSSSTGP
jgi:hypothetical protein